MVSVDAKHHFTYFRMARDKRAVSLLESGKERYIKATINNRTAVTTLETIVAGIAPRHGDSRDSVYEVHSNVPASKTLPFNSASDKRRLRLLTNLPAVSLREGRQ